MIDFALAKKRCCIFSPPGTGKTCAGVMIIDILRLTGEMHKGVPALVIAPPNVANETWPHEINKWDNLRVLSCIPIKGVPERRRSILRLPTEAGRAAIYTISYELLPWLVEELGERWPFRVVIADESHHLRGFRLRQGSVRARAVGRVAHTLVDYWVNFTGTPQPHDISNLWGQMWFVDRGERLERTYSAFEARYMMYEHRNQQRPIPRPTSHDEITKKISDVCLAVEAPPAPEPVYSDVRVNLPAAAARIYRDMERNMVAEIREGKTFAAFTEGSATNKCMQIANGGVYIEHPAWEPVHEAKLDALSGLLEEWGEPVIIVYQFKFDAEMICKRLSGAVNLSNPQYREAFKRGEVRHGIAHSQSIGEGVDGLQNHCRAMIRYGRNWNLADQIQMLARIGPQRQQASGHDRAVYVWDILADKTVDDIIMARHATRRASMDLLLESFL
jgi:hypothetical protein